ncbi:uncharacterized protein CDV56_102991 [Aspergillus thermomutatus]|uniref:Uncharacterized protein n=1 Tax=Aspergillus thermomutatus TaxID=41047 RepID=A0A397FYV3_ASPTH|nr:uncharacterized protein CDV56_102991 [Aspergillus thermomutatus]RHZ43941.1 hypothetical protein CDV56_102991 [Aspergillus thermomutatus]
MTRMIFLLLSLAMTAVSAKQTAKTCHTFPSSMEEYSAEFQQPNPPLIKNEFKTSFIQHKWNQNLSHVTSGYIYFSPSQGIVRADEAFDGAMATSVFDYDNMTADGLVDNTMTSFGFDMRPVVWRGYVLSNYPLFAEDMLVQGGATFGGLVERDIVRGRVAAWNLMYASIPLTIYVDACGVMVGFDYFSPLLRTRVITEFFNIDVGPVKV